MAKIAKAPHAAAAIAARMSEPSICGRYCSIKSLGERNRLSEPTSATTGAPSVTTTTKAAATVAAREAFSAAGQGPTSICSPTLARRATSQQAIEPRATRKSIGAAAATAAADRAARSGKVGISGSPSDKGREPACDDASFVTVPGADSLSP